MVAVSKVNSERTSDVTGGSAHATGAAKALVKGVALVKAVTESDRPLRLTQLAEATALPRPTVVRLLDVLRDAGLLSVNGRGEYSLGPLSTAWSQQYLDRLDVRRVALPTMTELASLSGETCFLGVRQGLQVYYVARVGGNHSVQLAADVGSYGPLYSTGLGKVLLAFAPDEVVHELMEQPLQSRTSNTITDSKVLRSELAAIRRRGYSTDDMENEDGVRCVAVSIRAVDGRVTAAMSVAAPAYRMSLRDFRGLVPRMLSAATIVSEQLGYQSATSGSESGHSHQTSKTGGRS
jgi:DNA-binding IclR family transcriptional regulator